MKVIDEIERILDKPVPNYGGMPSWGESIMLVARIMYLTDIQIILDKDEETETVDSETETF